MFRILCGPKFQQSFAIDAGRPSLRHLKEYLHDFSWATDVRVDFPPSQQITMVELVGRKWLPLRQRRRQRQEKLATVPSQMLAHADDAGT